MLQQSHDESRMDSRDDALEELATRLSVHLDCTQDVACRQILRALAESGQPLAPARLAASMHMSQAYAARVGGIGSAPSGRGSGHPLVLCHGDVWGGNLIAGAPPSLIFLDWESACLAPPERDAYGYVGLTFQAFAAGYRASMPLSGVGSNVRAEEDHEQEARDAPFTWNADLLAVYAYRKQLRNLAQWLHNLLHEQLDDEQRENDLLMIDEHCLSRWAGLEPALDQTRAAISR
jgi:hypothetical protein